MSWVKETMVLISREEGKLNPFLGRFEFCTYEKDGGKKQYSLIIYNPMEQIEVDLWTSRKSEVWETLTDYRYTGENDDQEVTLWKRKHVSKSKGTTEGE